ncbi:class A beta-lactamase-related serine hydrolase [Nocardia yunnanensis]|uniref:Class A beta-lactamase-related serine hydrolase n=1 Tax=Nocardia yunnanensis TaxID=2382165 RepID=A0A386ZAR0_9NOCA|nr:serine hydrolase domain-containing protein [Nocardia yunnanensis]AYF74273.1 class A beta-lactamase-related serine hydrolase [Nocardia yunnanensis]
MTEKTTHGAVAEGYGRVADAFRRNFERHGEIGAAVAVFDGQTPVVDLWGGQRDPVRRLPWERDTIAPVFSCTKGVAALVLALLVSRGQLDYDRAVADYWPEFAAHGKAAVTVRQLIDHQVGLHILRGTRMTLADLRDLDRVAGILAAQRPAWTPGTRQGYHPVSIGLFVNELVRRADPGGRSIRHFVAEEISGPLGVDFTLGLDAELGGERIVRLIRAQGLDLRFERNIPWNQAIPALLRRGQLFRALAVPELGMPEDFVRTEVMSVELPGSNGVGSARGLARIYAAGLTGELPIAARVRAQLSAPGPVPAPDAVLRTTTRFHLGFRKSCPTFPFGSPDHRAYGTPGLGGSLGFADPETGLSFAYVPNRLGLTLNGDQRCLRLVRAVFGASAR